MLKKLVLIILCISLFPLSAQENTDINQISESSDISNKILIKQNEEIKIYKQLLSEIELQKQNLERDNEQIQKALTISNQAFDRVTNAYWALFSIIITIVIFIFTGNIIIQHFDKKRISRDLFENVWLKCKEELDKFDKENKETISNTFTELNRTVSNQTKEAIEGVKTLQLELLKQELETNKNEDEISASMFTTLKIIGIYFDLYGKESVYNQYDGDIIGYFNYLRECLKNGNKFWNWNHEEINQLKKRCPKRLTREFNKVLELVEFDSNV